MPQTPGAPFPLDPGSAPEGCHVLTLKALSTTIVVFNLVC